MLFISTQISAVPAGTEPSETSSSCSGLYHSMAEYLQSIHLEFFVWKQQMPLSDDANINDLVPGKTATNSVCQDALQHEL